ncbi:MAG TPA: hypothetical protein VLA60_01545 [Nitrospirales bacterium]|nr:hypothetical protein [Nitrospirales bacterium]
MKGFERYQRILINEVDKFLNKESLIENSKYQNAFKNHIFGLSGPKQFSKKQIPSEVFFTKLFYGFIEISDSYSCLKDTETYIGSFPYRNAKISQTRYLAYHFENYLNEIYLLKERLRSYLKSIGRQYKNDRRYRIISKNTSSLTDWVDNCLKGIINSRGSHVHQTRFSAEDLDRLKTQEFLTLHGGKELKIIKDLFKRDYGNTRKKYKQIIKENNQQVKIFLDTFFVILMKIVANNEGRIRYPQIGN